MGTSTSNENWLTSIYKKRKLNSSTAEASRYLVETCSDADVIPLQLWKTNAKVYPTLASMAKTVLVVPATSVPSERVFSKDRLLINHLCCSLTLEMFQASICQ